MAQSPVDLAPPFAPWAAIAWPSTDQRRPAAPTHPKVDVHQVLAAWRAAERQLDNLIEASPMRFFFRSEVARLRAEYQAIFDDRVLAD